MKYQITCDNCGTQFIIDAEPGMTVECQCPECHGVMQITLPNAAKGEHYEAPRPTGGGPKNPWHAATVDEDDRPNRRWLWIGVAVVVLVVAVIGFAMFSTSSSQPEQLDVLPADTIPYEEPVVDDKPQTQVDTIVEQPEQPDWQQPEQDRVQQPWPCGRVAWHGEPRTSPSAMSPPWVRCSFYISNKEKKGAAKCFTG